MDRHLHSTDTYLSQHVEPQFSCSIQILVVDRPNGAADILMDTVGRLLDQEITITTIDDQQDAVQALDNCFLDMVVIGIERDRPDNIALVPYICEQLKGAKVIVVGHNVHHRSRDRALEFGATEVINLPRRATDLKALIKRLADYYLSPIY
jgi:DNA-binding NtrC family response regulator